jgi:hypothetical protein
MAATIVYEGVPNTQGETGTLFYGQKFWFSATVPQRKWFVENVKANGGQVVQLENQADVLLVDHTRKNPAPGTHSYKYVELSIRKGRLEKLDDHVVGGTSRADRPVGSITMAPKGSRRPYTEADDQFLWNWVKPLEEAGGATAGNSIYQDLEAANPGHTYQSWRDRWLKYVRHQKREVTIQVHDEEHPPSTPRRQRVQPRAGDGVETSIVRNMALPGLQAPVQAEHRLRQKSVEAIIPPRDGSPDRDSALPALESRGKAHSIRNAEYEKSGKTIFADDEYDDLFDAAPHILVTQEDHVSEAWRMLVKSRERTAKEEQREAMEKGKIAKDVPTHLAEEWRAYFEMVVGPDYEEQLEEETGMGKEKFFSEEAVRKTESIVKDVVASVDGVQENVTRLKRLAARMRTASQDSPNNENGRRPNSSFQPESLILSTSRPESPTASFSATQDRAPGPNEARKRSAGKGTNSQESTNSTANDPDGIEELSQKSTQSQKRKRSVGTDDEDEDSPSLPPFGNQEQAKRRRKSKEEPRMIEIPSTPEPDVVSRQEGSVTEQDLSQELGSTTPRPRRSPHKGNGRDDIPFSPLFVPQDHTPSSRTWSHEPDEGRSSPPINSEEDDLLPSTPKRKGKIDPDTRTSPLSVYLVSDPDPRAGSSFSQARSEKEPDNGSPTPEFETAPEFSQVWDTAQEAMQEAVRQASQRLRDRTVSETQPEEDFALPEPEGGWDDLPLPPEADEDEDESQDEEDTSSEAESIGSWVAAHLEANPDADDELLIRAAGIADLDFKLADIVYQHLVRGKAVPENMKGVWTARDDMALRGNDAKEIKRIEEKHGKASLEGRWQWLENE